jgi:hypothetical protein
MEIRLADGNDAELDHITKHIFYHLVPTYMKMFEEKKYTKMTKITLFHNIYLNLVWKKCHKNYHLTTTYTPQEGYILVEDDHKFIQYLHAFFTPKNIKKITEWYNKESESRK